jgi:hypothetical protein
MRLRVMAIVLALAAFGNSSGQTSPPIDTVAAIAWLAGDWEPERSVTASGATPKVIYHFRSIVNGRALSLQTTFNGSERFQGMIAYDPARKSVAVWYLTSTGESTAGTMTEADGTASFDLTTTTLDGKSSHLQLHIVHVDADHYRWEVYTDPRGSGMTKLFDQTYHRIK